MCFFREGGSTKSLIIKKQTLAKLNKVYAVSTIQLGGCIHFLAASEGHDRCLLFTSPDWEASVVWDGPGGCMSLVPVPEHEGALIAIQEFFPIFRSENAGIVYVEVGKTITDPWHVKRVLDLPFAHRIAIVRVSKVFYLVAATLCGGKDFQDDWSKPGTVYVGPIPNNPSDKWLLKPILKGISKNHGMHVTTLNKRQVVMISGKEGLFMLQVPENLSSRWECERLLEHEVSDVYSFDLDNDGISEIVTIEPFHGNSLVVYKNMSKKWQPVFETSMDFGHVVWAGRILGESAIIGGFRGGSKELFLLCPKAPDLKDFSRRTLDEGVGPTQIAVVHKQECDLILSANHGQNEVTLYRLTNKESTIF